MAGFIAYWVQRESASSQRAELQARTAAVSEMRNREVDDIKARLAKLESECRNGSH